MALRGLVPGAKVLDLYGGGLSSEWIKSLRPDVELVVAERDRRLWPALREDARRVGFTPIYGDFEGAAQHGSFDFVWLDLCGDALTAFDAVCRVVPLLDRPHARLRMRHFDADRRPDDIPIGLYVTIMEHSRRGYSELSVKTRDVAVTALLEHAAGVMFAAQKVHEYRQAGGRGRAAIWRVGQSYVEQVAAIAKAQAKRERDAEAYHHSEVRRYWHAVEREVARGNHYHGDVPGRSHARGGCRCSKSGLLTNEQSGVEVRRFDDYYDALYHRRSLAA